MKEKDKLIEIKTAIKHFLAEMEKLERQYHAVASEVKQSRGQKNNE